MARTDSLKAVLVLSLVVLFPAAAGCARPPIPATGPEFVVATYNVNFGMPRPMDAIDAIRAADADLVCLQETSPNWELLIRTMLSHEYPHMVFKHYGAAGGQAILAREPFEEIVYDKPDAGWFPGWAVRARTAVGDVQVLNVHLRPPLREDGRASLSVILTTRDTRRSEMETLYAHIDPQQPALVMGDFNEGDGGLAVSFLEDKDFDDALSQFDPSAKTWRWRVGLITLTDRFDHIMHSAHLECLHARVLNQGASDHLPVVARFQRKADSQR